MELPGGLGGVRVAGEVAIVTGGGFDGSFLGTGAAMSILLACQGASVGIVDADGQRAEITRSHIEKAGGEATVVVADVTDPASCAAAAREVADRYGKLSVLVNNAAVAAGGSVVDVDLATWDRVLQVNLTGAMLMSRAAIPHLRANGGGSVIHISSIAAIRGMGTAPYAAAKGGVIALTSDMAYSHGREGIRVNCIVPGHLHTPMGYQGSESVRDARRRSGLLGTEGNAWDVAWAAVFLASGESRWITAAQIPVDAGTTATTPMPMLHHLMGS